MSIESKIKRGVAIASAGISSLLFSGCLQTYDGKESISLVDVPATMLGNAIYAVNNPNETLSKPGVRETLVSVGLGIAAGNTTDIDSARALAVGSELAKNNANYQVARAAVNNARESGNFELRFYKMIDRNGDSVYSYPSDVVGSSTSRMSSDDVIGTVLEIKNPSPNLALRQEVRKLPEGEIIGATAFFKVDKSHKYIAWPLFPNTNLKGSGEYLTQIVDTQGNVVSQGTFSLDL